jgi:hypothetical protein
MSTLKVNQIENRTGTGDITLPTGNRIVAVDSNSFVQPYYSGQPLIVALAQAQAPAHITVTSTSPTTLALECPITVKDGSSTNEVMFFSDMMYGAANVLVLDLWYNVNGGSYTNLTTYSLYHWTYNSNTWGAFSHYFQHTHGASAGDTLSYQLRYYNYSSTATNYLVHNQMYYGWRVTEVAG